MLNHSPLTAFAVVALAVQASPLRAGESTLPCSVEAVANEGYSAALRVKARAELDQAVRVEPQSTPVVGARNNLWFTVRVTEKAHRPSGPRVLHVVMAKPPSGEWQVTDVWRVKFGERMPKGISFDEAEQAFDRLMETSTGKQLLLQARTQLFVEGPAACCVGLRKLSFEKADYALTLRSVGRLRHAIFKRTSSGPTLVRWEESDVPRKPTPVRK